LTVGTRVHLCFGKEEGSYPGLWDDTCAVGVSLGLGFDGFGVVACESGESLPKILFAAV